MRTPIYCDRLHLSGNRMRKTRLDGTNKKARIIRASVDENGDKSTLMPSAPVRTPLPRAAADATGRQRVRDALPAESRLSAAHVPRVAHRPQWRPAQARRLRQVPRSECESSGMCDTSCSHFVASTLCEANCREAARTMRSECDELHKRWSELQVRGTIGVKRRSMRRNDATYRRTG